MTWRGKRPVEDKVFLLADPIDTLLSWVAGTLYSPATLPVVRSAKIRDRLNDVALLHIGSEYQ